jgi:holo-[acyl-carrier protein] synthase
MVKGIGIDLIEVDRVESKIRKESGFREFVFSPNEIQYCESKPKKYEHYAACFAAKEAFLKALGTGWNNGISFNEIEIKHVESGQPEIVLSGATAELVRKSGSRTIKVSLTHLQKIAGAVVILESD